MATPPAGDPQQRATQGTKGFVGCFVGAMVLFLVVMLVFFGVVVFWSN